MQLPIVTRQLVALFRDTVSPQAIRAAWDIAALDYGYAKHFGKDPQYPGPTPSKPTPITIACDILRQLWVSIPCAIGGHNWRDDSYGGPDSGCYDMTCERCGYSFSEVLY